MKRPLLYGPNGKPLALGLYPTTRNNPHYYRRRANLSLDTRRNVSAVDRREMLNTGRILFAQCSNLGTAILDKNRWAFGDGWEPHYTGQNSRWGDEVTEWLRDQWMPFCDFKGQHAWRKLLYLSGVAWDRDGDDLMLLTEDANGSGFPKVLFLPGARIGNAGDIAKDQVIGGRWDGYAIYDGVIFDSTETPVAVRVIGKTDSDFTDYSIGFGGNADLAFQPEWQDHGRGIPLVGRPHLDWQDLDDIDAFLKRGIKRASSIGLIGKTEDGQAPAGNEILVQTEVMDPAGETRTITCQEIDGGEAYYFRAGTGEGLEGLNYQTPHPNVEAFIARIERRAIRAVGWAYELINLSEAGRAATRLVCSLANQSIWTQQELGLRRTWRAVRYAIAKGQKNGFISRNPDPFDAYFSWDFGLPAPISVDQGNDEQADRENLKVGTTNKALIAQKKGLYWRNVQSQRRREIIANAEDAAIIERETAGRIPFDRALELLEQRGPNPVAQVSDPQSDTPPKDENQK